MAMKHRMTVLLIFWMAPLFGQDVEPPSNRGPSDAEIRKQREEFLNASEAARRKAQIVTASIRVTEQRVFDLIPGERVGDLFLRSGEDKRTLVWEEYNPKAEGGKPRGDLGSRSFFAGAELIVTEEVRKPPIAEKYDVGKLDVFFAQIIVRDWMTMELENFFHITITHDPRNAKTQATEWDLKHFGEKPPDFNDPTSLGYDPDQKMDPKLLDGKLDQESSRKLPQEGPQEEDRGPSYHVMLRPKEDSPFKDVVEMIQVRVDAQTYMPVFVDLYRTNATNQIIRIRNIVVNPTDFKDEAKFSWDLSGYTILEPQKEE